MTITGGDLDSSGFSSIFAEIIEETEEFEEAIDNIGSVFGTTFTNLIEQSLNISDDFVPWEGLNLDVLKIKLDKMDVDKKILNHLEIATSEVNHISDLLVKFFEYLQLSERDRKNKKLEKILQSR